MPRPFATFQDGKSELDPNVLISHKPAAITPFSVGQWAKIYQQTLPSYLPKAGDEESPEMHENMVANSKALKETWTNTYVPNIFDDLRDNRQQQTSLDNNDNQEMVAYKAQRAFHFLQRAKKFYFNDRDEIKQINQQLMQTEVIHGRKEQIEFNRKCKTIKDKQDNRFWKGMIAENNAQEEAEKLQQSRKREERCVEGRKLRDYLTKRDGAGGKFNFAYLRSQADRIRAHNAQVHQEEQAEWEEKKSTKKKLRNALDDQRKLEQHLRNIDENKDDFRTSLRGEFVKTKVTAIQNLRRFHDEKERQKVKIQAALYEANDAANREREKVQEAYRECVVSNAMGEKEDDFHRRLCKRELANKDFFEHLLEQRKYQKDYKIALVQEKLREQERMETFIKAYKVEVRQKRQHQDEKKKEVAHYLREQAVEHRAREAQEKVETAIYEAERRANRDREKNEFLQHSADLITECHNRGRNAFPIQRAQHRVLKFGNEWAYQF